MIRQSKKDAIVELKKTGMSLRDIAKTLKAGRNTVTKVLDDQDEEALPQRNSRYEEHVPLIQELFKDCKGNAVRVVEELESRHQIKIPYQSLTWIMRKYEIRERKKRRAGQYYFKPGQEMQHDTSPHLVVINGKKVSTQCASLTLAFCRRIFIQYYPCFTRFECKVFLKKAFEFMDGVCSRCMIDNTSVIVVSGTGPDAVIAPEMKYFGDMYGTRFEAHAVGDANRSARVERPFHFVENNFLPGRTFVSWQDLNEQAIDWCRNTSDKLFKRALGMIPDEAYIIEKPHLIDLPPYQPPVYVVKHRVADVQGYVHLDTNRYSVPESLIGKSLEVQKHWLKVIVYDKNRKVAEHDRILDKKNTRTTLPSHHVPIRRKKDPKIPSKEERLLTGEDAFLDAYVAELKKRSHGRGCGQVASTASSETHLSRGTFFESHKTGA